MCIDGRIILGAKIDELFSNQGMEIAEKSLDTHVDICLPPVKEPTKGTDLATINNAIRTIWLLLDGLEKRFVIAESEYGGMFSGGAHYSIMADLFKAEKENWK